MLCVSNNTLHTATGTLGNVISVILAKLRVITDTQTVCPYVKVINNTEIAKIMSEPCICALNTLHTAVNFNCVWHSAINTL